MKNQLALFKQEIAYTTDQLLDLATASLRYRQNVDCLLEFYTYIRELWDKDYIKAFARDNMLNLRKRSDRITFSQLAAEVEYDYQIANADRPIQQSLVDLTNELSTVKNQLTSTENELKQANKELKRLRGGKPLNGTQNSAISRMFGSPTTRDMLISQARKLRIQEHPDTSDYPQEIAIQRFQFVQTAYTRFLSNWETRYDPTLEIDADTLKKAMNAKLPFPVESFQRKD